MNGTTNGVEFVLTNYEKHTLAYSFMNVFKTLPAVLITMVVDLPDGTIRLVQRVEALHDVTVARLVLRLVVAGVRILYFVREVVFGVRLLKL